MMRFPCFLHLLVLNLLEWNQLHCLREQIRQPVPHAVDPGPDAMDVDLRGDEDDDEMGLGLIEDHCIHYYHRI